MSTTENIMNKTYTQEEIEALPDVTNKYGGSYKHDLQEVQLKDLIEEIEARIKEEVVRSSLAKIKKKFLSLEAWHLYINGKGEVMEHEPDQFKISVAKKDIR